MKTTSNNHVLLLFNILSSVDVYQLFSFECDSLVGEDVHRHTKTQNLLVEKNKFTTVNMSLR